MELERIHRVMRPIEPGETFLVPHVDGVPVLWPPHRDPHTGQPDPHFHGDPRFGGIAMARYESMEVEWKPATATRGDFGFGKTSVQTIAPAIERIPRHRNCLKGGAYCPHGGFNMRQVRPDENGLLVCPLHGMRFRPNGNGAPFSRREVAEIYGQPLVRSAAFSTDGMPDPWSRSSR